MLDCEHPSDSENPFDKCEACDARNVCPLYLMYMLAHDILTPKELEIREFMADPPKSNPWLN